jgi:hypothetical protein
MGGAIALLVANAGNAIAFPLAKDCNNRKIPDVIKSLKELPNGDSLLLHPILVEALYNKYGRENSADMDYLRRLEVVVTGGGKLENQIAVKFIALGITLVSIH